MEKVSGAVNKRSFRPKKIGDVTTVTIPQIYIDYLTKKEKEVSDELVSFVNAALSQREYVHLVMTGIAYIHTRQNLTELIQDFQGKLNEVALMGEKQKAKDAF
ncbi:hypothetical protein AAXB25_33435 [Paenibacillus lautus]|uniref:hypothetical protein n=1 Tax=Paenibacillus lautus TaxID=1401 RepID=UPI003D2A97DD